MRFSAYLRQSHFDRPVGRCWEGMAFRYACFGAISFYLVCKSQLCTAHHLHASRNTKSSSRNCRSTTESTLISTPADQY